MNYIISNEQDRLALIAKLTKLKLDKPRKVSVEIIDNRTVDQNKQQWHILSAFADQMYWPVSGEQVKIDSGSWKDILTASFHGELLQLAPTLDRQRMVAIGLRTREFKESEWPEWMAFLKWAAAEHQIRIPLSKKQQSFYEGME